MDKKFVPSKEQEEIIHLDHGKHLVLAPPGTGKTELIAQRVKAALSYGKSSDKMICLTFTNRAAKGMRDRINEKYPNNKVFIGNIHHFCSTFLFNNNLVPLSTALIDEEDSNLILEEAKTELNFTEKLHNSDLILLNTQIKQRVLNFPESVQFPPKQQFQNFSLAVKVCEKYESIKKESSFFDFDDLLTYTYYFLSNGLLNFSKFNWIQVDEVQDINPLQWEIIKMISNENAHMVLFGDYEQAIFSFMGAKLERLHVMEKECNVHNLQKNFRSPKYLLKIFNDYAKTHLNPKWKKEPFPENEDFQKTGNLIISKIIGYEAAEAQWIINNIIPRFIANDDNLTAILVRTNNMAELYSQYLKEKKLDHFKVSGYDLFRRKIVKDTLAFLGCLENELDRISWFRILNIFGDVKTLKESRLFVNKLFKHGFIPTDFLRHNNLVKNSLSSFFSNYGIGRIVIFDTETTGLNSKDDDIIQIAAVEIVNGLVGKTFEVYLKTDKSLQETQPIHGISNEFLQKYGLSAKEGLKKFHEFVNGDHLLAHNLKFDLEILKSNNEKYLNGYILKFSTDNYDSIDLTRRIYPFLNSYKLKDLIITFGIEGKNTHNALDDVMATVNLIKFLYPKMNDKIAAQGKFIKDNENTIANFRKNFIQLWNECIIEKEVTFIDLINNLFRHLKSLNYDINKEEVPYVSKFAKYTAQKCGRKPILRLLSEHVPEFKRFKEVDLILGTEKIIVSTVHKAKGLEFENVIIPGCIEGEYPFWASETTHQIEEDARLLYVAMTRAKRRLVISSYSKSINQNGREFQKKESHFIDCIRHHFENMT